MGIYVPPAPSPPTTRKEEGIKKRKYTGKCGIKGKKKKVKHKKYKDQWK
jgi:hypothetical protein